MFKVIEFIMSFFGASMKQKIMSAIKDKLLGSSGGKTAVDGSGGGPLGSLMNQFKEKGLGSIFNSWVGSGKNELISPDQVQSAIGSDKMEEMSKQTGMPMPELAKQLSKYLPGLVDKMTPGGKLPGQ